MSDDKCFICMRTGHKAHECQKEEKDYVIYGYEDDDLMCLKCGRWNHLTYRCYAKSDIFGNKLNRNSYSINKKNKTKKNKKTNQNK